MKKGQYEKEKSRGMYERERERDVNGAVEQYRRCDEEEDKCMRERNGQVLYKNSDAGRERKRGRIAPWDSRHAVPL